MSGVKARSASRKGRSCRTAAISGAVPQPRARAGVSRRRKSTAWAACISSMPRILLVRRHPTVFASRVDALHEPVEGQLVAQPALARQSVDVVADGGELGAHADAIQE